MTSHRHELTAINSVVGRRGPPPGTAAMTNVTRSGYGAGCQL